MTDGCFVILGANSAIAVATARQLAAQGSKLALVARSGARLEELSADLIARGAAAADPYVADLSVVDDVEGVYASVRETTGDIAGILVFYGILGDQEKAESDYRHALEIIDVNFRSAAAWTMVGAQVLESSSASNRVLLGVSSVAGDRGRRSNFVYGAAKGGFSTLLQGLAHKWGGQADAPRAIAMKLGFVDTPMTDGFDKSGALWAKPEAIASVICKSLNKGGPIVYGPWLWRWIMLAVRMVPPFVFNRVNL